MENLDKGTSFSNRRALITFLKPATQNRKGQMQVTGLMSIGTKEAPESRNFILSGKTYDSFLSQNIVAGSIVYVNGYDHTKTFERADGSQGSSVDSSVVRINIVEAARRAPAAEAAA